MNRVYALNFLRTLALLPRLEIVWIDEILHAQAMTLLENRIDKDYSLCDAASFVLIRGRGITEASTTDKHFVQEGFVRLLPS
ncbi:MAG: type II toxin-antitoxin system VapC family toxin [Pyrinomonadaceae bacterium]